MLLHGKTPLNIPSNLPRIPREGQVNELNNNLRLIDGQIAIFQDLLDLAPPLILKAKTETVAVLHCIRGEILVIRINELNSVNLPQLFLELTPGLTCHQNSPAVPTTALNSP